jgi:BolA family transcriptional regulator, general stress-responsive regulator
MNRVDKIRAKLEAELKPEVLNIIDESHLHAGHKSAGGLGHFKVEIRSNVLDGMNMVKAHQEIYKVLDELMQTDIHALSIKVL